MKSQELENAMNSQAHGHGNVSWLDQTVWAVPIIAGILLLLLLVGFYIYYRRKKRRDTRSLYRHKTTQAVSKKEHKAVRRNKPLTLADTGGLPPVRNKEKGAAS